MLQVSFYDEVEDSLLIFAVIIARTNGKWVLCKHKERDTYEVPGGHREENETILETAKRELREETGAVDFTITPVCVYSVKGKTRVNKTSEDMNFGMLYVAEIFSFEEINSEIEKILITEDLKNVDWTYPLIQPKLLEEANRRGVICKKKVLYMGFKGKSNASCSLAMHLSKKPCLLTNSFEGLRRDIEQIEDNYDYVYMFGIDTKLRNMVRIERGAEREGIPVFSKLDLENISECFNKAGVENSISEAYTQYLCNEAYWYALRKFEGKVVFIHIPSAKNMDEDFFDSLQNTFK